MNREMRLPLSLYIHWPFCKAKCPYCDFNSHVRESVSQEDWRRALLKELDYFATQLPDRQLVSIFFGGGTPSLMDPKTVEALITRAQALWPSSSDIEITLEANPTSVEAASLRDFKAAGVNRVSLGVQSLRDDQLKFLGRQHSAREALSAVETARGIFDRYSFDLIYARPGQSVSEWEKELREALPYAGRHLSLYQLTIEEGTQFYHHFHAGKFQLPPEDDCADMYALTQDILYVENLPAYEISNHAQPGEESRHNLAYWKGDDYLGIGPGAHGRYFSGGGRIATECLRSPEKWLASVEEKNHGISVMQPVDPQALREELLMMGLRIREGISFTDYARKSGAELESVVNPDKLSLFIKQGFLERTDTSLRPSSKGMAVLNRITSELLTE